MRFGSVLAALALIVPVSAIAQNNELSIGNYQLQSSKTISGSITEEVYSGLLFNTGGPKTSVTATLASNDSNIQVVQGTLHFAPVPQLSAVPSNDTFTVRIDRSQPAYFSQLRWTFNVAQPPIANAGPNQTATLNQTVMLNGSGSTNPSGVGVLTYSWAFTSKPAGSAASLFNANTANPSFIVNPAGTYIIQLTVTSGSGSSTASVTVNANNSAPVANAGAAQTVPVGSTVHLNGGASSDVDGNPLTYSWLLLSAPSGSTAALTGATTVNPAFVADKIGSYIAQLTVNDGSLNSAPSTVTITTGNSAPVANAGANRFVNTGSTVNLSGAASTDVDGNPLTYLWTMLSKPAGSLAVLSSTTVVNPSFLADVDGDYTMQLIVNDGQVSSAAVTVTITTGTPQPPVANAGPDQTVLVNSLVTVNGSGTSPQGAPLTYQYVLTSKPAGSTASLQGSGTSVTFIADKVGNYIVQLIVNDGTLTSAPDTATITTANTAPVANAGPDQSRVTGTIILDGTGSHDADGDALTYAWSLTSKPNGSNAILSGATTGSPSFNADFIGIYVAQLIVNDGHTNSSPVTVQITILAGNTMTLSPSPLNLTTLGPGTLTVTLAAAAGVGGQTVNLVAFDNAVASPAGSVFIAEGSTAGTTAVNPGHVGATTIIASGTGLTPTSVVVNVVSPVIGLGFDSSIIGLGTSTNATITLNVPAPSGGSVITLSADHPEFVSMPGTVNVAGGASTATFSILGTSQGTAVITASSSGYGSATNSLVVSLLGQMSLPSGVGVTPTQSVAFPVTLSNPAGPSGVTVNLSSDNQGVVTISPSSVFIASGALAAAVAPQITGVNYGTANIAASAVGYQGVTRQVGVTGSLSFAQVNLAGGVSSAGVATLNLNSPAPAGVVVNLHSDNTGIASVPATVSFATGATAASFPVTFGTAGNTTLRASSSTFTEVTLPVNVASLGSIVLPIGQAIGVGETLPFPVSLSLPAPAGGVTVNISSLDTAKLTISTSTLTFNAGQTTPASQPTITGVGLGVTNISANGPGLVSNNQQVNISANTTLGPSGITINGIQTQNLTLSFAVPVPTPIIIQLSSSSPTVIGVPATVTADVGATSVVVPVTSISSGSAVITATPSVYFRPASASISVFVAVQGNITVGSANISLAQTSTLPISISPAAPAGGVTVNLASNNAAVTVSPTAFIAAGATSPATLPTVTGANFGTATITGSAANYSPGTGSVQVNGTLNFTSPTLSVSGTSTVNLVLSLGAPAPSALTINVASSNTGKATVPATVTFAAGATTVNVPVTGVAPGSTTITASASALTSATASVTVTAASDISLPAGVVIGPGEDRLMPITMRTPAPAGGVYVNLASSDTSKVTITPPTVYVPAGATTSIATPRATAVAFGSSTISATANGLIGDSQTVKVAIELSFVNPIATIPGVGQGQTLALKLSSPSPAGGISITLSSSSPGVATVQGSLFMPAGVSAVSVLVNGITPGVTTINASGPSVGSATATVTVLAPGSIGLSPNVNVTVGQYATFPITLAAPAIAPVTITLTSANERKMFLSTSTVTIPAGATQPATQPQVGAFNIGTVNITASAPGYATVSAPVQANSVINFDSYSVTMAPSSTKIIAMGLTIPAPPGHTPAGRCEIVDSDFCSITINMRSDNPSIVQVQPTVTYYPDGSNPSIAQVIITGGTPGTTTIHAGALPYIPEIAMTVNVLGPGAIALQSGINIVPGQTVTYPVALSSVAPAGGLTVALSVDQPSNLSISVPSVFIAAGATTPAAQPTISGLNFGQATVHATASGWASSDQVVKITGALSLAPLTQTLAGATGSLTLTMNPPPPVSSITVNLASSNTGVVGVPASIIIPQGASSVTVPISAGGTSGVATISADSGNTNITPASATVTVGSVNLGGITTSAGLSTKPGQSISFPITLSAAAPAGGVTVTLSSANGIATVTPSVFIGAGLTAPSVQPQVTGVLFGNASITASAPGFTSATQSVSVGAALSFASTTLSVVKTASANLQVVLSVPAPAGGVTVNLGSSNVAIATVPSSVNIPAGSTSVNVSVTGAGLGSATITALSNAPNVSGASAAVTVTTPDITIPSTLSVSVGSQTPVSVLLSNPAPAGGVFVLLSSSDTGKANLSTSTVFIAQGATVPVVQPTVSGVALGTAIITASASGLVGSTATVQVGAGMTFAPGSISISGTGTTQFLQLNLPTPAPVGGTTVNLSSSNPAVATVPQSIFISANSTSVNVGVTSVGAGSTTIQATASGIAGASAIISVTAGATIGLPVNMTVPMGGDLPYTITLGTPAGPGGVYVTLTIGDSKRAKISPVTVFIPGGATTPAVQPVVTSNNVGLNSVTASAPGYGTTTQQITSTASVKFVPNTVTVRMGETGRLYLQLGSAAPLGHTQAGRCEIVDSDFCSISVNVKSDNTGVAYVQPTFTYYPDGSNPATGLILFSPMGVGTTVIHAGAPYISEGTITVIVTN